MRILVTGGAGYIGSHTCVALIESGHDVVVLDNFSNSHPVALERVADITGQPIKIQRGDVGDRALLEKLFAQYAFDGVIHFAGSKAVGESVQKPLLYYRNNVTASQTLIECMLAAEIYTLVFSSSATVYGDPVSVPIDECFALAPTNPYGRSKLMVETIMRDVCDAHSQFCAIALRYFNPAGAHPSGLIGEDPDGPPNNLMPYITQVATGQRPHLAVFGDDYPTRDGTGIRDYLHVCDLAEGHVAALEQLAGKIGSYAINLGTGQGTSVLEMVEAYRQVSGQDIPCQIAARRPGDIAECYANPAYAHDLLGWQARRNLQDMVSSSWHWQSRNPNGYQG